MIHWPLIFHYVIGASEYQLSHCCCLKFPKMQFSLSARCPSSMVIHVYMYLVSIIALQYFPGPHKGQVHFSPMRYITIHRAWRLNGFSSHRPDCNWFPPFACISVCLKTKTPKTYCCVQYIYVPALNQLKSCQQIIFMMTCLN